jgi:hypothetical protein
VIDLAAALRAVVSALEAVEMDYVVVGSTAAAAWGSARTTRDLDLVVMVGSHADELLERLSDPDLYVPVDLARGALDGSGSFNVLHLTSGGKVDVFVADPADAFTRSRLSRRVRADVLGVPAWVATPEDVVLAKLRWRLDSRSEVQWRDCVEIAATNELDVDYLESWAGRLGVEADLSDLLSGVDGGAAD